MYKNHNLTIGLFGFGVVGEGIYDVLNETPSLNASIKKICIKDPLKKRNADPSLFTTDYYELLEDPEINLIVELINDADEAFKIVRKALQNKKAVVSANKKMIAENLTVLLALQNEKKVPLLYEAAVCGSIPIIRNLEEYYDNDMMRSLYGIVNGSTNFILTKIIDDCISYDDALLEAKIRGFAESDPELDVSGRDTMHKLVILLLHAYGIETTVNSILYSGIKSIQTEDANFAIEKKLKIKLIAQATKLCNGNIAAFVLPQFVKAESQVYNVSNEFNGVVIESKFSDQQFLYGKGAGRYPTASAVLSDIAALRYDYQYEYRKLLNTNKAVLSNDFYLKIYVSYSDKYQVNTWDFECIEVLYNTEKRQYLIGIIPFNKLRKTNWFANENVSVIVMPDGIIEKGSIIKDSLKQVSLQLAGI